MQAIPQKRPQAGETRGRQHSEFWNRIAMGSLQWITGNAPSVGIGG
jgi:hypothetical protein